MSKTRVISRLTSFKGLVQTTREFMSDFNRTETKAIRGISGKKPPRGKKPPLVKRSSDSGKRGLLGGRSEKGGLLGGPILERRFFRGCQGVPERRSFRVPRAAGARKIQYFSVIYT